MIYLTDDGSLDTVVMCGDCGAEGRYNYDGSAADDPEDCPLSDKDAYDDFIDWAIEDFSSECMCGEDI